MSSTLAKVAEQYSRLRKQAPVGVIRTRAEYERATRMLDAILDEIGEDEKHNLADLAETIAHFVEEYDERNFPVPEARGTEVLRFLMEQHRLKQSDLPEVGSQGVVSEILSGRRDLNVRQIAALARRFSVPADVFMGA
jgi:HTH-type transcriptional regulator/antitoxin HigA